MQGLKAKLAGLALAGLLALGVYVSSVDSSQATSDVVKAAAGLCNGAGCTVAAKELDATTQSGGPTAEQNQKIQEVAALGSGAGSNQVADGFGVIVVGGADPDGVNVQGFSPGIAVADVIIKEVHPSGDTGGDIPTEHVS